MMTETDIAFPQDALQNYTENTNWGTENQFQTFFGGDANNLNQGRSGPSPGSGDGFSFSTPGSSSK